MPWWDTTKSADERTRLLMKAMTPNEKYDSLGPSGVDFTKSGYAGGFIAPMRLGLPGRIRYNDGP